ncbi:MAG: hypothetical protein RLZZ505_2203 [Verrucomicrobiota bacterium]
MNGALARLFAGMILFLLLAQRVLADVAPVTIRVPEPEAWIGQRLSLHVELRAPGSFTGSANFELPQLPGTLLMKIGNPVVSSETIDGKSWFVQSHEFALFSQKAGPLEVPPFPVRFERQESFTGPSIAVETRTPATTVQIQRPPGSEAIGFLITTESLELAESWDPAPGPSQVGAVFKRTIIQRAPNITGMALIPAPNRLPEGIRAYPPKVETFDKTERGDFIGERRETLTYQITRPGSITLPEIRFVWWNPETQQLATKSLPAVTLQVAALPAPETAASRRALWPWIIAALLAGTLLSAQRLRLLSSLNRFRQFINPPHRSAARDLLRACKANAAATAYSAWSRWTQMRPSDLVIGTSLHAEILALQRHLYGPDTKNQWDGDALCHAFHDHLRSLKQPSTRPQTTPLPRLNEP